MNKQTDDVSTDWQKRAEELEQLVRDALFYIKEIAPYSYAAAPRCIALQDRAAALGIVLELSKAEKYHAEIDARRRIQFENREKPWLPPDADGEL